MRSSAIIAALSIVLGSGGAAALAAEPAPPGETPAFDVTFPEDWSVEEVQLPLEGTSGMIVLQAGPPGDPDTCQVADLGAAGLVLDALGVRDAWALQHVAADLLGRGGTSRSSGLGYGEAWSSYMEGPLDAGDEFSLYSYLGREAWPGLEHAWLALLCSSQQADRDRWQDIASSLAYRIPDAVLASTGPVVLGGLVEAPAVSLRVPTDWMAVDLSAGDHRSILEGYGSEGEWFGRQLDGVVGDDIERAAADGGSIVVWAWATDHGYDWPEHCTVATGPQRFESARQLVDLGRGRLDTETAEGSTDEWGLVGLRAGEAARFDYAWTPTSGGVTYFLFHDGRQVELACSDQSFAGPADERSKRARWEAIAESMVLPPSDVDVEAHDPVEV